MWFGHSTQDAISRRDEVQQSVWRHCKGTAKVYYLDALRSRGISVEVRATVNCAYSAANGRPEVVVVVKVVEEDGVSRCASRGQIESKDAECRATAKVSLHSVPRLGAVTAGVSCVVTLQSAV